MRHESEIVRQLKSGLAKSDSRFRKHWADQVIQSNVPLTGLLGLLQGEPNTAQRFMWFIGDICEKDPDRVVPCLPILFDLRDEMPFPGMPRSVAKWLLLTEVPDNVESEAISQLFEWLEDDATSIACKSHSAKCLVMLAEQNRVSSDKLMRALSSQAKDSNRAFAGRMKKLLEHLQSIDG